MPTGVGKGPGSQVCLQPMSGHKVTTASGLSPAVQAQVCKAPEHRSPLLAAAPQGEGAAGIGGADNT